ncbi:MAG: thioredoxin domain-containing protein [Acidobacteria bacterium]|nr:thioredoxin domain-containing protein [Acidobacteriota bacterium]
MKLAVALTMTAITAFAQGPLIEGKKDSPVRVVIWEDLQCPDCADFRKMLDEKLLPKYGAKVAFEHRDFPLAKHSWARRAAVAARYIQGISEEAGITFRRETMAAIREIKAGTFEGWLKKFCESHGLDPGKAAAALSDERLNALVQKDFEEGTARGIARTPTALVNGEPFIETFTLEEISKGIESALKENGIE